MNKNHKLYLIARRCYHDIKLKWASRAAYYSLFKNYFSLFFSKCFHQQTVVITLVEHLGDIVACEPISRFARQKYPHAHIIWLVKKNYAPILLNNPNINKILHLHSLYEWTLLKKLRPYHLNIDLHIDGKPTERPDVLHSNPSPYNITIRNFYHYGNLLFTFAWGANIDLKTAAPNLDISPQIYLSETEKKLNPVKLERYIVIHPQSSTVMRNWQSHKWEALIERLAAQQIHIVEVGIESLIQVKNPFFHSFCSKLSLREIAITIKNAQLFIGVDSAFAHFANALRTPGVILLGKYGNFTQYMPYSGYFEQKKNAHIIQYAGFASEIPLEEVLANIPLMMPSPPLRQAIKKDINTKNISTQGPFSAK